MAGLKDIKINKEFFANLAKIIQLPQSTTVGVSIGTSSVKIVELKKSGKSWKLLHFGVVQLPEDAIVNREILNPIAVTESIKTLINQLKLKSKIVCTSLSGTSVIIKRMTVEAPRKSELQEQVFWEAEQYLPFDISEVVMDFHMLSRAKDSKTDVILVAAKSSVLDSYTGVIEDAGLQAKIVDTDFFALHTAFEANYPQSNTEAIAIVDIGASALKVVVVHANVPVFTKESALGGRNLTAEIQKHLNLSFNDAEALKTGGQGAALPQEVMDLMAIMNDNFATEIKRALDFYAASASGAPVSQVLLSGGSSKVPGLPKTVEDAIHLPTQLINPFGSVTYDPAVFTPDYVQTIAPVAAIPIGLAIRGAAK